MSQRRHTFKSLHKYFFNSQSTHEEHPSSLYSYFYFPREQTLLFEDRRTYKSSQNNCGKKVSSFKKNNVLLFCYLILIFLFKKIISLHYYIQIHLSIPPTVLAIQKAVTGQNCIWNSLITCKITIRCVIQSSSSPFQ